jgi:hypothetical protein
MRALYDPPFLFEINTVCLTVSKKDTHSGEYTKYRILSLPDAHRIYPDVCKMLCTDDDSKQTQTQSLHENMNMLNLNMSSAAAT